CILSRQRERVSTAGEEKQSLLSADRSCETAAVATCGPPLVRKSRGEDDRNRSGQAVPCLTRTDQPEPYPGLPARFPAPVFPQAGEIVEVRAEAATETDRLPGDAPPLARQRDLELFGCTLVIVGTRQVLPAGAVVTD